MHFSLCYLFIYFFCYNFGCSLVSTSGGGMAYSIVSNGLKIKPAQALLSAAAFAVLPGTYYKVIDWFEIVYVGVKWIHELVN